MISINTYILEKLTINKDTKVEDREIKYLTDLYEVGDKCLLVKLRGLGFSPRVHIDAAEITKKSKTILYFKCLTNIGWSCKESRLTVNRNNNAKIDVYKSAWTDNASLYLIVPYNETKDVITEIEENNNKLKNFSNLYVKRQEDRANNYKIVEMKDISKEEWHLENLRPISNESINKIKKALGI